MAARSAARCSGHRRALRQLPEHPAGSELDDKRAAARRGKHFAQNPDAMNESRPQLFGMLAGLFLAAGLVLSSMLGTAAWVKIKNSQFITVKGSARKNIESDLAIWRGSFRGRGGNVAGRAAQDPGEPRAWWKNFSTGAGVTNYSFASIGIEEVQRDPEKRRRLDAAAHQRLPLEPGRARGVGGRGPASSIWTPRRWWSRA